MKTNRLALSILALAIGLSTVSCGKNDTGSADLDMSISSNGLILATDAQSCVDVASVTSPPTRSLSSPVLRFGGFSLLWKNKDRNLYIGQIKITVKSSKLSGGKFTGTLDSAEIEALLGATNATLTKAADDKGRLYASNSTVKEPSAAGIASRPCALGIGGLTLANPNDTSTTTYTATVTIDLIGTSFKPDDGSDEAVVRKTITATATAY